MKINRRIFINKKTGQASITLPKKNLIRFFKKVPLRNKQIIKLRILRWIRL